MTALIHSPIRSPIRSGSRVPTDGFWEANSPAPEPRIAGNNIAYALGDSEIAQNIEISDNYAVRGLAMSWGRRLMLGRLILPLANISGGSGETAATIRSTRLAAAVSSGAKVFFLCAGTNQGTSLTQDTDDVTYMAEQMAGSAADAVCFVSDLMPGGTAAGWNATRIARHADLRDAIRLLDDPANGIYVVPTWDAVAASPDADESAAGMMLTTDYVHPAIPGAYATAQAFDTVADPVIPAFDPWDGETFANDTTLNGANLAGSTNDAISTAGLGAANVASSRMVVDGATTWAELTLNTTSTATVNKSFGTMPANVTAGTTNLSSIVLVKVHSSLVNCRAITLRMIKQSGLDFASNAGLDGLHMGTPNEIGEISAGSDTLMVFRTPTLLTPADATQVRWQLLLYPELVGAVTQTMTGLVSIAFPGTIIE